MSHPAARPEAMNANRGAVKWRCMGRWVEGIGEPGAFICAPDPRRAAVQMDRDAARVEFQRAELLYGERNYQLALEAFERTAVLLEGDLRSFRLLFITLALDRETGVLLWASVLGSDGVDSGGPLAIDGDGNVWLGARFGDTIRLDGTIYAAPAGFGDVFVARLVH